MKKLIFLITTLQIITVLSLAQNVQINTGDTIIISPLVGIVIDSAEKVRHLLFPYYSNTTFISAVFIRTSDSTINIRAAFKGDSITEKLISNKEFTWLKNLIEGNYFGNIKKGYRKPIFGKEKVNISTGFGLPELLNLGLRYQFTDGQLGLSVGSIPWIWDNEGIISVSCDAYIHFGKLSKLSNKRPWYSKIGLNYMVEWGLIPYDNSRYLYRYLSLIGRIGRDFNISKKICIELDAGATFILFQDYSGFSGIPPVIPGGTIVVFYRL